ncbi:MAG: SDR family oxidoreductase [Candidatus Omnitrophica bacterium]|nr:SDR family oxidoreductase [Candidatus Omnitrophota bacterium]
MFTRDTLKDKTFLITGGGSGLGLGIAKRFAELGANIAICGRTKETLEKAARELEPFGTKISPYPVDVSDYEAVGTMFEHLISKGSGLEGLINNAGANFLCFSEELSPNGFKAVVDIALHGTFNCSQHFAKYLIKNKKPGSILNIVTTYTETGSAFILPSACAKAGVYAMTTTLAYEWAAYGIRVNAIAPGPFPTGGAWSRLVPSAEYEKIYLQRHPMHRFGEIAELANLAVFLMSDLASYINGECVAIDGGERLQGGQFNFLTHLLPRSKLREIFAALRPRKK